MPHSQPLPTRLQDGTVAVALGNQHLFANPDATDSLPRSLSRGDQITVFGEPANGKGKRWWRVRQADEAGFAWTIECDQDRYYLEPAVLTQ